MRPASPSGIRCAIARSGRLVGAALTLLLLLPALAGCSSSNTPERAADRLVEAYRSLARAIEREDIDDVMDLVSVDFFDRGITRRQFRDAFEEVFFFYNQIDAEFVVSDVEFDSNRPEFALVFFDGIITGVDVDTGQLVTVDRIEDGSMIWRREGGTWRMYGDQRVSVAAIPKSKSGKPTVGYILGSKREAKR